MPYDRANTLRLIDETDRYSGTGNMVPFSELERTNALRAADGEITRLVNLIRRLRPFIPTHGGQSEDLINAVEAVIDSAQHSPPPQVSDHR